MIHEETACLFAEWWVLSEFNSFFLFMIFIIVVSAGTSGVAMEETTPSTSRSESGTS